MFKFLYDDYFLLGQTVLYEVVLPEPCQHMPDDDDYFAAYDTADADDDDDVAATTTNASAPATANPDASANANANVKDQTNRM